jgi:hypothetical protein
MSTETTSHMYMFQVYKVALPTSPTALGGWYWVMATPVHYSTMHAHFRGFTGLPKRCRTIAVR